MQVKYLVLIALVILLVGFSYMAGLNKGRSEPIDAETLQELRAEEAVKLYSVVDVCMTDLCLETFSKETQMDIRAK